MEFLIVLLKLFPIIAVFVSKNLALDCKLSQQAIPLSTVEQDTLPRSQQQGKLLRLIFLANLDIFKLGEVDALISFIVLII